jgi:DNA-directed RNA polymerase subunit RPC12/RpoP
MAATGILTIVELAGRTVVLAILSAAAILLYARLMRVAQRIKPERMPMVHAVVGGSGMILVNGAFAVMLRGTPFGDGVQFASLIPLMIGMTLAVAGWSRRMGDSMHCPRCEYELGLTAEADAPIRCPECGTGWLGRLKKGRRVRSPRLIAAGIAIAVIGMIVLNPIFYMGTLAPHLPTPLLYASLYAAPKNAFKVWDELATRTLGPEWTRTMAERVLAQRGKNQYDNSPGRWFETMIASGKMPKALADRFYREGFQAELLVPKHVKAGESFTASLRVSRAAQGSSTIGLMFAGYAIDDNPARLGRRNKTQWAFELQPGVLSRHRDVLAQPLTADHPGEVRVRVVYWLVYQPSFRDELAWQADGSPAAPTAANWFQRIELEQPVRVE